MDVPDETVNVGLAGVTDVEFELAVPLHPKGRAWVRLAFSSVDLPPITGFGLIEIV